MGFKKNKSSYFVNEHFFIGCKNEHMNQNSIEVISLTFSDLYFIPFGSANVDGVKILINFTSAFNAWYTLVQQLNVH